MINNNTEAEMEIDTTLSPNNNSVIFKPELIISQAINLSDDFIPIDEIKLAELANFTPKEITMLKLFWNPCFNSTWIYLSDDIILNFLTNETGKDAINHFMRQILIPNNEKEIDYLQVDKNHELIKSCSLSLASKNEDGNEVKKRIAPNKKYYIVSGECFKNLLMQSKCAGKETRKYFLKVEKLSRLMYSYISELKDKKIENEEKKYNLLFNNHQSFLKRKKRTAYEKGDCVYILSNPYRKNELEFKIGKVDQKDKGDEAVSAFVNRLSTYNTGLPDDYIVEYVCYVKQSKLIEDMIKGKYEEYFKVANKEWVFGKELLEISEFIRNCCNFLGFDFVEKIPNLKLKDELEIKVEEVFEDPTTEDYESDEEEFNDALYERMKEIDITTTFKQVRKICRENEIIQLGGKSDMIRRIVRFENSRKRNYDSDIESDDESTIIDDSSFIYQYNNKGEFICRFKCVKDIKIDGINKNDIKQCLENKADKAGNFIWKNKETKFTKELREINRKNCMTIIKIDKDGNDVERYKSIKETCSQNNIGRGVVDRMIESKQFRNGFGFKYLNKDNKVSVLTKKDKENLAKDYKDGMTVEELCTKYGKVRRYMMRLVHTLKPSE